jgi:CheY-like chemotaxis protein
MAKILIVGPAVPIRTACARALEQDGYRVVTVGSKAEALSRLERVCPDLVILEEDAPGICDCELLRQLTARKPRIPVLMMASAVDEQTRSAADACVCVRPRPTFGRCAGPCSGF